MKNKLIVLLIIMLFALGLSGCNYKILDTHWSFDRAIIKLANDEIIDVKVQSWTDYEGEQLQIIAEDGTVYMTNSYRCDLIGSVVSE